MFIIVGVVCSSAEISGVATRTEVLVATITRQFQLTMNRIMYRLHVGISDFLLSMSSGGPWGAGLIISGSGSVPGPGDWELCWGSGAPIFTVCH